jgi:F0F1-type ATP synthase assembly protein I
LPQATSIFGKKRKMNKEQQADATRRNIAGIVAILLGLAIGIFIKRVRVGLLIGLVLGFVAISLFRKK